MVNRINSDSLHKAVDILKEFPIPRDVPISVVSGIASFIFFWIFILLAGYYYPGYSPFNNWMSDLGSLKANPQGGFYFNLGCVVTGITLIPFFLGLYEWYIGGRRNMILTIATQVCGVYLAFSIIMIGLNPIDNLEVHGFWAINFFTVSIFVTFFPSIALYKYKFTRNVALYGFFSTAVNIAFRFFIIMPIIEWATILFSFSFIIVIVVSMQRRIKRLRVVRKAKLKL
ncbi:MAG: conserved membrane protein of unknown function [Promethearchaeota archaeon]|nr:MAG: conserved membrane protein of unknown function [Candidatus Lokiarchaeota archaeon]